MTISAILRLTTYVKTLRVIVSLHYQYTMYILGIEAPYFWTFGEFNMALALLLPEERSKGSL